jgi:hypothetical protein
MSTILSKFKLENLKFIAAEGNSSDVYSALLLGKNADVDTAAAEDLWDAGGTWAAPTSAGLVGFASSSAADAAAGTGARTIRVTGLDGSYLPVTETLSLNGVGSVNTTNSYFIVHSVEVLTVGSGGTNAGVITGTSAGGGTPVLATVAVGKGGSQLAIYQVPAGYTGYVTQYSAGVQGGSTTDVELYVTPFGGAPVVKGTLGLNITGSSFFIRRYDIPLKLSEKSIVKLRGTVASNNTEVHGCVDLLLIKN